MAGAAREPDRGASGTHARAASWLVWSACGLILLMIASFAALSVPNG